MPAIACSYDMNSNLPNPVRLRMSTGECFFCDMRCLAKWALQRATNPRLPPVQRDDSYMLVRNGWKDAEFSGLQRLTAYAVNHALGPDLVPVSAVDAEIDQIRDELAYEQATRVINCHCVLMARGGEPLDGWYGLNTSEIDLTDEVRYLEYRHLIKRHPEHPDWVALCNEGEPLHG